MTYEILRKVIKKEYVELRRKVRDNILINSQVAESKRRVFYPPLSIGSKKEMIVGGLVLEKSVSHSCSLYSEGRGWEHVSINQLIQQPSLINTLQSIETTSTLVLFDFSGVFAVSFSPPPMAFSLVKEGDIAYATGIINPIIFRKGQGVFGTNLLTEEDMELYKKGESCYSAEDISSKNDVAEIKKSDGKEELAFLLQVGGSSLEIVRRLLIEISYTKNTDLYWIIDAVYNLYSKHPSERLYSIVKKYYYRWCTSQNDMETEDKKEYYLQSLFPVKHR